MLPLDRERTLEHIVGLKWFRVRLLRTGDVARVIFERDVQAVRPADAIALIEQRCVVEHPDHVYEFDGAERVWTPRPDVEGAPA
jgi:hypothetical protein